jgi:hypothetical protein
VKDQTEIEGMGPNPARYRRLAEPFSSSAAAHDAMNAFFAAVGKVREEHEIPDVVMGVRVGYISEDGEFLEFAASLNLGDSSKAEAIAAFTFGQMSHARETAVAEALQMARRGRRP